MIHKMSSFFSRLIKSVSMARIELTELFSHILKNAMKKS